MLGEIEQARAELALAEASGDPRALARARARCAALLDSQTLGQLLASARPWRQEIEPGPLRPPFIYHGGKFDVAGVIEEAMGPIVNLIIPFAGGLGELLGRSQPASVETINDVDALIANVWRSLRADPVGVALACDRPVIEVDLHAAHAHLVARREWLREQLERDRNFFDAQLAGDWIAGRCAWLGGGWCNEGEQHKRRPAIGGRDGQVDAGRGVHSGRWRCKPMLAGGQTGPGIGRGVHSSTIREDLPHYMRRLAHRLRYVRIICGDWRRATTTSVTTSHGITGIFFDPPYEADTGRSVRLYGVDDPNATDRERSISASVRSFALEAGPHPRMRIVVAGEDDEHAELERHGWGVVAWKRREKLWLSPHCRQPAQLSLDWEDRT